MTSVCGTYEGGEGYYDLKVPTTYFQSKQMDDFEMYGWLNVLDADADAGYIRRELADKIRASLLRMPDLTDNQSVSVSFSGGKDSQAIFLLACMRYPKERIISLFADTQDEWPETYKAIAEFEKWIGVPIHTVHSMGIHKLLRGEAHLPAYWPRAGLRHCTKNLKMIPQRDWFDENGYSQDRQRGKPSFRDGRPLDIKHPAPLTLAGERWAESKNRSTLPFDSRDDVMLRWTHRPVLDWRIEDIWEFIFWMNAPLNPIYQMGVKRAACAGCIFANGKEIELLGEHHPGHLIEWVETERVIGHPRMGSKSFREIHDQLVKENRLGNPTHYEWDGKELKEVN